MSNRHHFLQQTSALAGGALLLSAFEHPSFAALRKRMGPSDQINVGAIGLNGMGWADLSNGALFAAAESGGFDLLISCDQNLVHQQNLTGRHLAVLVLDTNRWAVIRASTTDIAAAAAKTSPGSFNRLALGERSAGS